MVDLVVFPTLWLEPEVGTPMPEVVGAVTAGNTLVVAVLLAPTEPSWSLFATTVKVVSACSLLANVGVSCSDCVALVKLNAVSHGTFTDVPEGVGANIKRPVAHE